MALFPDAQHLQVHLFALQCVQCAEWLHEHELGIVDQSARDGCALLHAARKVVGHLVGEAAQAHHVQQFQGAVFRGLAPSPIEALFMDGFQSVRTH